MKLQRWTTRPTAGATNDAEDRAGALLRQAAVRQPLDASALAEIRSRLPDERRTPPGRLALRFGLALLLFLSGGGVVMSATLLGGWSPFRRVSSQAPAVPAAAEPLRRPPAPSPVEPAAEPEAVVKPSLALAPAPLPERARAPRLADAEPAAPTAPDVAPPELAPPTPSVAPARAPSAIAEEAALVGAALRRLRESADAAGALALLDERDRRFGAAGTLGEEALTTRVEALLNLGQRARALALLDAISPRAAGRGRALLASRGELRADAGHCREADTDFDALLADDAAWDGIAERALYGRAACRSRLGESDAARADLEAYVARFPGGRFAARARAALAP